MTERIEALLRRDRWITAAALLIITVLAWAWLLAGAGMGMSAADMTRMVYGDHAVMPSGVAMPPHWGLAYWGLMFAMWWVMMAAMMLPSAVPVVLLAAAIGRRTTPAASPFGSSGAFLAGYLLAWGGFSVLATAAQWALERAGLVSSMTMAGSGRWLLGGLLLAAGAWQLTPLKQACLRHCRSPVQFLVAHRGEAAMALGLRHGVWCLGCCWFLMALLFVGGVMNLFWIAGLAVIVLLEKLLPAGPALGRALGILLVLAGAALWAGFGGA